jgi:hypothetical protein
MWNIQARYVKKMIVMTTGGEYCNFHRVNSSEISSQVSQTNNTTQMFSVFFENPDEKHLGSQANSSNNAIHLISDS